MRTPENVSLHLESLHLLQIQLSEPGIFVTSVQGGALILATCKIFSELLLINHLICGFKICYRGVHFRENDALFVQFA